jgi:hypothetical protein
LSKSKKLRQHHSGLKKGVRNFLGTDRGRRAVPRPDRGRIGQGQEFLPDPAHKQFAIAARQIPPADPAAKKHIAPDQESVRGRMETQTAIAVPGDLENIELPPEKILPRSLGH